MNHYKGFILFAMLVFLQVMSFMLYINIETALQTKKLNAAYQEKMLQAVQFNALESVLTKAVLQNPQKCLVGLFSPLSIKKTAHSAWVAASCTGNLPGFQYYYTVESLGQNSCAIFADSTQKVGEFYRITYWVPPDTWRQMIIVKPSEPRESCHAETFTVQLGKFIVHDI